MVSETRTQSGAAQSGADCAESLGHVGLLPGKGVAEAHMGIWMNRVQRDTRMVLSVVANQCFLEPVLDGFLESIPESFHIQIGGGLCWCRISK